MARKLRLSKSKQAFVNSRKSPGLLRGLPLRRSEVLENSYAKELSAMARKMGVDVNKQIRALFKKNKPGSLIAMDASLSSEARILINKLRRQYESAFAKNSKALSEKYLSRINKYSNSSTKTSIEKLAGGLSIDTSFITGEIKEALKISNTRSVNLIKSIPSQYFEQVEDLVMRSLLPGGNGLADLTVLDKIKDKQINRGINIAKDQTRKALNNLNAIRMEKSGVTEFVWRHSGGSKDPRELHLRLDGQVFSYDDLPIIDERTGERGLPGQVPYCRCFQEPVAKFGGE